MNNARGRVPQSGTKARAARSGFNMIFGEYDREMDIAVNRREAWEDGRTEGMERGMEKGREEGKLLIAKNLLVEGSSPEFVQKITGLPPEKINKLK